jgi:hypothetical protein
MGKVSYGVLGMLIIASQQAVRDLDLVYIILFVS